MDKKSVPGKADYGRRRMAGATESSDTCRERQAVNRIADRAAVDWGTKVADTVAGCRDRDAWNAEADNLDVESRGSVTMVSTEDGSLLDWAPTGRIGRLGMTARRGQRQQQSHVSKQQIYGGSPSYTLAHAEGAAEAYWIATTQMRAYQH